MTRTNSAPGANATIRIRGITSMKDSSPLVIIDGAPGAIGDVNPADVENISVLKDAASAAIYGARAAAGVILITTKRAKSGEPTSVDYTYSISLDYPTRMPEYEDAVGYMKAQNEQMYNDTPSGGLYSVYTQEEIAEAIAWVDSIPRKDRFSTMTDDEIRRERLVSRGLATSKDFS